MSSSAVAGIEERRKRGGHTWSKARFIAAQIAALLEDGRWLALAGHANRKAAQLAVGLEARNLAAAFPVEANEVFVWLPPTLHEALQARGAGYYVWSSESVAPRRRGKPGEVMARLITSFATTDADVAGALVEIDDALGVRRKTSRSPGTPLF